jgi:hypothetical protein
MLLSNQRRTKDSVEERDNILQQEQIITKKLEASKIIYNECQLI